jgi:hypothetical protein
MLAVPSTLPSEQTWVRDGGPVAIDDEVVHLLPATGLLAALGSPGGRGSTADPGAGILVFPSTRSEAAMTDAATLATDAQYSTRSRSGTEKGTEAD